MERYTNETQAALERAIKKFLNENKELALKRILGLDGLEIEAAEDKDININTYGTGKAYYKGVEIGTGGGITGSGTINYIPRFTGVSAIGNSHLIDDGTKITSSEDIQMLASETEYFADIKTGAIFSKKVAVETIDFYGVQITPYNTHETFPGNFFIGDTYAAPSGDGIKITDTGIWLYPSGAYSVKINNSIAFQGIGGGQLGRARFENLSTPPTTDKGGVYHDTDDNNVYVNKGTYASPNWQPLGGFTNPLLEDLTIKEASPMLYFQNASGNPLGSIGSLGSGLYIGNDVDSGSIYIRTGATPTTRVQIYDTGVALGVPLNMNSGIIQSLSYLRTPDGLALLMQYGTTAPASRLMIGSGITAYTSIAMSSNKITGLANPTDAQDAVTKAYFEANALTNPLLTDLTIKEASPMLYFQNASGNPLGSIGSLGGGFYIGNDVDAGSIYIRTGVSPVTRMQIYDTAVALGVPLSMGTQKIYFSDGYGIDFRNDGVHKIAYAAGTNSLDIQSYQTINFKTTYDSGTPLSAAQDGVRLGEALFLRKNHAADNCYIVDDANGTMELHVPTEQRFKFVIG